MNTILITGANRGIGLELTKQYLSNNARVIACCRDPHHANELNQLKSQYHSTLVICQLDVSNFQAITSLSQQLANEKIDILINNAGIIGNHADTLANIDADKWQETFKTNTIAPTLMAQAFLNQLSHSNRKLVVNISSVMGSIAENTSGGYYLYRSSKAALNAVTKSLSIELKPKNIIAVVMHPGWVQTDMGGDEAPLTTEQSVTGIRNVIDQLTLTDSGTFVSYDGRRIPW